MKKVIISLFVVLILQSCASSTTQTNGGAATATTVMQSNPEAPKESYLYKGKQVEKNVSTCLQRRSRLR